MDVSELFSDEEDEIPCFEEPEETVETIFEYDQCTQVLEFYKTTSDNNSISEEYNQIPFFSFGTSSNSYLLGGRLFADTSPEFLLG